MSENNHLNDDKEPIDSIEKTVEDLKKKIQELSLEEEKEEFNETQDKVSQLKETASETINQGIQDVKEKANEIVQNEDIQKTITFIKENAVKAKKSAEDTLHILKNDPNIQNAHTKATETIDRVSSYAKQKTSDVYNQLDNQTKATISSTYKMVVDVVKEGIENAQMFYYRDDIQEKIGDIKDATHELSQKGITKLKSLFKK